ncbi:MAG: hypothetical protein WDO69_25880 [Pseudomonadota bacterium]
MSRSRLAVLGLCVALGACGEKFVAGGAGSGGSGGTSSAGHADVGAAGEAASGGSAGDDSAEAGAAGVETGGVAGSSASGGTGGLLGNAGAGGGASVDPVLPELGLLIWLRADRGIQQKDGFVQVWQDQSGNQTNATQAAVNVRPAYLATGFNGRPTLEFDGQGQFLKFADGFGDFSKGLAGFIVAKPTKSDCASMLEFSNGSEVDDIALGMWQNKWTYEVETPYIQTGEVDHDTFSLYAVNHRLVGATELRIDGSTLGTLEMPTPIVPESGIRLNNFVGHTLYAGGCEYFRGQISEIILYSRTLTNTELVAIEKYLDAHWALSEQGTPAPSP